MTKKKSLVDTPTQTGVSNWLTVFPITEFGFESSKHQFWDSMRLQCGWEISNLRKLVLAVVNLINRTI